MTTVAATPTAEQERMVLHELLMSGSRGAHSHELARRLPILNVPERVRRLRNAGWAIESTREKSPFGGKSWGTRYRLSGRAPAFGDVVAEGPREARHPPDDRPGRRLAEARPGRLDVAARRDGVRRTV